MKNHFYSWKYLLALIIIFITCFSCAPNNNKTDVFHPAQNGTIDLSEWDFDTHGIALLTGDYQFKWEDPSVPWETINVPSNWNDQTGSGFGTGWYSLDIKLNQPEELLLYIELIQSAYELYIDGKKALSVGKPRGDGETGHPWRNPVYIELPQKKEFNLFFKVSNYYDARGGIITPPLIGRPKQILDYIQSNTIDWGLLLGILGIMILYHLVLWSYRKKDKAGLFFTLLGTSFFLRSLVSRVYQIFDPWIAGMEIFWIEFQYKIEYICMAAACLTFLYFVKYLFYIDKQPLIDKIIVGVSIFGALLALVTPLSVYSYCATLYHLLIIATISRTIYLMIMGIKNKQDGAIPLLAGSSILFLTVIWEIILIYTPNELPYYSSKGLIILFIAKAFVLAKRYTLAINTSEYLTENLQKEVTLRTRKLKKANLYQSRFFANISHEFRTPLTLLLGPLESIIGGEWGQKIPIKHPTFDSMYRNTGRLLKLVNNILSYSRIQDESLELKKDWIDLREVLLSYVVSIKAAAESKQIKLAFKHPTSLQTGEGIRVFADKELLEQAILNLLSNALKFTPPGGNVALKVDNSPGWVHISVEDTGIGIPEEYISSIFERYRQLSESKQKRYEGSGIGLALVKEITESHGGRVTVKSSPGKGSVFTLYLPKGEIKAEPQTLPVENKNKEKNPVSHEGELSSYWLADMEENPLFDHHEKTPGEDKKETVLIVEDSHSLQGFLRACLENRYHVVTAANGRDGIEAAEKCIPDLVISDIMMPDMDGYDFTRVLKKDHTLQDIPVILLSAKADITSKLEGFEAGAVDYIVKPFNNSELLARVAAQLEMKRLREKLEERNDALGEQKKELEKAISEKEKVMDQLAIDEAYFRDMADRLPSIVIESDKEGKITYMNQAADKVFGSLAGEDNSIFNLLHPTSQDPFSKDFASSFDGKGRRMFEYNFRSEDNRILPILLRGCPVSQGDGFQGIRFLIIESDGAIDLAPMPDSDFYEKYSITKREQEVLAHIIKGKSNKEICGSLFISEITVKKHITSLLQKTNQKNRRELRQMINSLFGDSQ